MGILALLDILAILALLGILAILVILAILDIGRDASCSKIHFREPRQDGTRLCLVSPG